MDYKEMTAPCGLDCFNCPMYKAYHNEDVRKKIASLMQVPEERAFCKSCRGEDGQIGFLNMQEPCQVYQCTSKKSLHNCSECQDFPCDHLHPYADRAMEVPHNTKVFNLALIKKMGLEKWAGEKAASVKQTYFKEKWKI